MNKLNDEGLSVLAACHVLFYTKHTWKDNIAENIPEENLFNCIQEDRHRGVYIHRNSRRDLLTNAEDSLKVAVPSDVEEIEGSEDGTEERNYHNRILLAQTANGLNFRISELSDLRTDYENPLENGLNTREKKHSLSSRTEEYYLNEEFFRKNGLTKTVPANTGNSNHDLVLQNNFDKHGSGTLLPASEFVPTDISKLGKTGLKPDITLFSILSAISSTRDVSDSEDVQSENSVEQNKQVLLALQRFVFS